MRTRVHGGSRRSAALDARLEHGLETAGELLDHIEALEPHERRQLLDQARAECGLESTAEVDAQQRATAAVGELRPSVNPLLHSCAAPGCRAIPRTESGAWAEIHVTRWWCEEHRNLALPGDMETPPAPWRYSPSGAIVPNDPQDEAREAAIAESRRAELEARDDQNAAAAAELREHERGQREQLRRESPLGVPS